LLVHESARSESESIMAAKNILFISLLLYQDDLIKNH